MSDFVESLVDVVDDSGSRWLILPDGKRFELPMTMTRKVKAKEFRDIVDNAEENLLRLKKYIEVNGCLRESPVLDLLKSNLEKSCLEISNIYCSIIDNFYLEKRKSIILDTKTILTGN